MVLNSFEPRASGVRSFYTDGKVIEMHKFNGSLQRIRMGLKRWLLWFLLAFVAVDFFLPSVWLLAPIEGQVVDAISGRPIAGAAVAASWDLEWMAAICLAPYGMWLALIVGIGKKES